MQTEVWDYYQQHARDLPWRQPDADGTFNPYHILVSEVMLQQTHVSRVIPKYSVFIAQFPTAHTLAAAPLGKILQAWSGLGYNRRAKYLHQAARQIGDRPFPQDLNQLMTLPGVGYNTAAAIMNYAYDQATPFIETNIRTVYIHHYFQDQTDVNDKQLLQLVDQTMDRQRPREWFWALMDYGSHLKTTVGNLNRQSRHYTKQARFEGSRRQIRGQIIKLLNDSPHNLSSLTKAIPDQRLSEVLQDLLHEDLITKHKVQGKILYNTHHDV